MGCWWSCIHSSFWYLKKATIRVRSQGGLSFAGWMLLLGCKESRVCVCVYRMLKGFSFLVRTSHACPSFDPSTLRNEEVDLRDSLFFSFKVFLNFPKQKINKCNGELLRKLFLNGRKKVRRQPTFSALFELFSFFEFVRFLFCSLAEVSPPVRLSLLPQTLMNSVVGVLL